MMKAATILQPLFFVYVVCVFAGCESSPLGPDIAPKDPAIADTDSVDDGGDGVSPGQQPDGGSGDDADDTSSDDGDEGGDDSSIDTSIACTQTSGHDVWYFGSAVSIAYTCAESVTDLATNSMPSFLTASINGTAVSFSGTAPQVVSNSTWSFGVNDVTTTGDAAAISTQILDPATISLALDGSPDIANNRNTAVDLEFQATLSATWDGSMDDVEMITAEIDHDMHGVQRFVNCSGAVAPYVCDGSFQTVDKTYDPATELNWSFSAFDQGSYYLTVSPEITIEGGTNSLTDQTTTFSIPIQTNGKVSVSYPGDVSSGTFQTVVYNYSVAIGRGSTDAEPVVSTVFFSGNGSIADTQFKRLVIDRTDDPTGGATGVTESTDLKVSGGNISLSATARSVTHSDPDFDGDWIVAGIRLDGTGENVYVARVPDGATPAAENDIDLTNFNGTSDEAKYLDMTQIFDDNGTERFGIAYVRSDGSNDLLTVAKINPLGTSVAEYIDDSRYDTDPAGNQFEISGGAGKLDRVKIRYIAEDGGRFYVAYRDTEDLEVVKLRSSWDATELYDHVATSAPFTSVFTDAAGSNLQTLDMAVGAVDGSTIVGITYRDENGDCYFRKLNEALDTAGSAIQISTGTCYFPSIHWIAKSGKFVVTWGELNAANSNRREVRMSEITLGSPDAASSPLVVADTAQAIDFQHLDTDYYADGDWMAVFYRNKFLNTIHIHGYHVPGR